MFSPDLVHADSGDIRDFVKFSNLLLELWASIAKKGRIRVSLSGYGYQAHARLSKTLKSNCVTHFFCQLEDTLLRILQKLGNKWAVWWTKFGRPNLKNTSSRPQTTQSMKQIVWRRRIGGYQRRSCWSWVAPWGIPSSTIGMQRDSGWLASMMQCDLCDENRFVSETFCENSRSLTESMVSIWEGLKVHPLIEMAWSRVRDWIGARVDIVRAVLLYRTSRNWSSRYCPQQSESVVENTAMSTISTPKLPR